MQVNILTTVYTVCFVFGAVATIVGFVLGIGHHGGGAVSHAHHPLVHLPAAPGSHGMPRDAALPVNPSSILAFLVVFGAVGLVLQDAGVVGLLALVLAAAAGLIAGWIVFLFVVRFLARGETYLVDDPLVGTVGKISVAIGPKHIGEILYTRHGVQRSDGARAVDGREIVAGEDVVIVDYANGIATVQRWQDFLSDPIVPHAAKPT